MDLTRRALLTFLLLFLAAPTGRLEAREAREQARIEHLLGAVGGLGGAQFVRNGSAYDAQAAEKHLRQKLNYAGERLKTAEQFVEYCATKSSVTGQPYRIRFANGETTEAAPFLRAKLAEYDRASGGR